MHKVETDIIELRDVCKTYEIGENQVKALCNVNIKIEKGDFIAIMGPSGSGKSTGMNLIGSLDSPTKGRIFLDNHDIAHLEESEIAQIRGKKIGFIFQSFNLVPNLTARENIALPMIFQNINIEERNQRVDELLRLVNLIDRGEHYPNQLSGGQQQRVAIARALANDPEVILADEPTGNLDTKTGEDVLQFLENLNKKGKTIIMITHSLELAEKHAKKVYWIKDGVVERITVKEGNKWREVK